MSVSMNAENRNTRPVNIRSCSFCRRAGHNILTCNSRLLRNFEAMCINNITSINNSINIDILFREFLLSQALNDSYLIKSFAIRYCRASLRNNIYICINNIIDYFNPFIEYRRNLLIQINSQQSIEENQQNNDLSQFINNSANILSNNNNNNNNNISIAWSMLFIDMILSIHESNINRKFDIKININENIDILNEKCDCKICYEEYENNKNFVKLDCGHEFCKDCIKKSLQNEKKITPCCAFCRKDIIKFDVYEESIKNEFSDLIN